MAAAVPGRGPGQLPLLGRAVPGPVLGHRRHGAHGGLLLRQLRQELGGLLLPLQLQSLLFGNL